MNLSNRSEYQLESEINVSTGSGGKVFIVKRSLGDGAFNTAYLVCEKGTPQKHFVYKCYKSGQEEKNYEVTILSAIRSRDMNAPVVKVLESEVIDQDGRKGHTEELALGEKISDRVPTKIQALKLAINFAQLLKTCAEEDIAYRDVKPFDHVFWEPDKKDGVKNMTVIDWNISRRPASLGDLYFDLVEYCRCLPEFFLGNRPSSGRKYYHPLSWHYDQNVRTSIDPILWLVLSNISFNFSCPSILNGSKVLEIGSLAKETIIDAWDNIIKLLNNVLNILNDSQIHSDLLDGFPEDLRLPIGQWIKSPEAVDVVSWLGEKVYGWSGRLEFTAPPKHTLNEMEPVLTRLRVAHIVGGGTFRETLLFSFFLAIYRTGIYLDGSASQFYEDILKRLLENQPPSQIYNKETEVYFDKLASIARSRSKQDDSELYEMAGQIWDDLGKEFKAWVICDSLEIGGDLKTKQKLLVELDHQHPRYIGFKVELNREEEQQGQLQELNQSIENGKFENAKRLVKKLYSHDEKSKNSYEAKIDFCKRLYSLRDKKVEELSVEEVEDLVKDAPRSSLPDSYQSQLNDLRGKLLGLKKLRDWRKELLDAENVEKFDKLYRAIESGFDSKMADVARPIWLESFGDHVRKRVEYIKQLQMHQRVEDLLVFEKLRYEFEQLHNLCSNARAMSVLEVVSMAQNHIESAVAKLEPRKEQARNSFLVSYERDLSNAGNHPDKLKDIANKLGDPVNERLFERNWLAAEKEKVNVLWGAAKLLQDIREYDKVEWKINEVIDKLQKYPEGRSAFDELSTYQANFDIRQQILNSIENTKDSQSEGLNSIKLEVDKLNEKLPEQLLFWFDWNNRYGHLSEKIALIEKKVRGTGRWTIAFGLINFLLLLGILLIPIANLISNSTQSEPTASAIDSSSTEATQTPTITPTATIPPPSPTQMVKVAVLLPDAVFYANDKETELWVVISGQELIRVEILNEEDGFSFVQIKAVIGRELIDLNTMEIIHPNVKIRAFEDTSDPPQIGAPKSIFPVEIITDILPSIDEKYQPVILTGWVKNEFLQK